MIANPKKQATVNFTVDEVNSAFSKIVKINKKYTLQSHNAVMGIFTLSALEFLSVGVYIDLSSRMISQNQTEITIEVRRKIGAFDEAVEVQNANKHIEILLSDITELLSNPDTLVSTAGNKETEANKKLTNLLLSIIGWILGLLFLGASFMPYISTGARVIDIFLFLLLINKSIRKLFKKLF
jgi:hypothetical protein